MELQVYDCILFDFDGTLVPSLELWLDGFKYALSQLGHTELPEHLIIERCFYRNDAEILREFNLQCATTFWGLVEQSLSQAYDAPPLFPGVREILAHCTQQNIFVGMVTSSERRLVLKALAHLNLADHFSVIVTADDITNFKPHPEPVLQALSKLGCRADRTLFVGDYVVDVLAGKAAGTQTAIFFNEAHDRFHKLDHLRSVAPDFVFSDYSELLQRLSTPVMV